MRSENKKSPFGDRQNKNPASAGFSLFFFFIAVGRFRGGRRGFFTHGFAEKPLFAVPHDKERNPRQYEDYGLELRRSDAQTDRAAVIRSEKLYDKAPDPVRDEIYHGNDVETFEIEQAQHAEQNEQEDGFIQLGGDIVSAVHPKPPLPGTAHFRAVAAPRHQTAYTADRVRNRNADGRHLYDGVELLDVSALQLPFRKVKVAYAEVRADKHGRAGDETAHCGDRPEFPNSVFYIIIYGLEQHCAHKTEGDSQNRYKENIILNRGLHAPVIGIEFEHDKTGNQPYRYAYSVKSDAERMIEKRKFQYWIGMHSLPPH